MPTNPQYNFRTTALDQDHLSTSFGIKTNWHVITGAPCSGKTTIIDQLAARGFRTVPEIGRVCFERERVKGRTFDEIREDGIRFQRGIIDLQLRFERGLPMSEVVFLDRGSPDALTYCRVLGLNPNAILPECFPHRYASVFILDRFPFQGDGMRFENDTTADLIDEWLCRDYSALGYGVLRVPILSIEERIAFILEKLAEQGLMQ